LCHSLVRSEHRSTEELTAQECDARNDDKKYKCRAQKNVFKNN